MMKTERRKIMMFKKLITIALLIALVSTIFCNDTYAANSNGITVTKGVLTGYTGPDTDVVIPGNLGIKEIGANAFVNKGITSVIIPEGVTAIKWNAFSSCKALTSVTLPNSLTSIGDEAFKYCTELITINLPTGLKSIGTEAFCYCSKMQSLLIPESVTSIENGAFAECKSITSVTWPKNVTKLGTSVFINCANLASVSLPDTVTEIGGWAFTRCKNLKTFEMPSNIQTIGNSAFKDTSLPEPILIKNNSVLCYVPSTHTSYTVPATVTTINGGAFCDGVYLTSVSIPDSVTVIGDEAFKGCIHLASIKLPTGLTTIGERAFYGCHYLTDLTIPQSVTQIGGQAFSITALKSPILSPDGKILYFVPASVTSYTIPETVDTIKAGAFERCANLETIDIPDRIKNIGEFAFSGCSSLKAIVIPNGVTSIGQWTFNGCSSLALISVPSTVKLIAPRAFADCTSLTSFNVPASVSEVQFEAFTGCSNLRAVIFSSKYSLNGQDAFSNCNQLTIFSPAGSEAENYAKTNNIPFAPSTVKVALTKSTVSLNGTPVKFEAYNFNGSNYFKLRDIAYVFNGTDKQFDITFDPVFNVIYITTGKAYTLAGGELEITGKASIVTASRTMSKIYLDGKEIDVSAYLINGQTYFKLRNIGQVLDFGVDWSDELKLIAINTSKGYI